MRWDAARGVYLDDDGAVVPVARVQAALARITTDSADRLQILAERYRDGRLDLLQWRVAMRAELKTAGGTAASLASGGLAQMDARARGVLSGQLRRAYGYLDLFALDLAEGRVDPASDAFTARARQYAGEAHSTYHHFQERQAVSRGMRHERNILGGSQHCDACLGQSARGWVPVGALVPIGSRSCLSNCRCHIQFAAEIAAEVSA